MEVENKGEQLESSNYTNCEKSKISENYNKESQSIISENDNCAVSEDNASSSFGKFNSADELLSAYNNLQAEFTRKCQKLSDLTKNGTEQQIEYSSEDWTNKVAQFVCEKQNAKKYASEISEVLMKDKEISKSKNSLNLAYQKVISNKYKEPEELLEDEQFISTYIMKNKQLKDRLLKSALEEVKTSPSVIGSSGTSSLSRHNIPASFSEAGDIVLGLFKQK